MPTFLLSSGWETISRGQQDRVKEKHFCILNLELCIDTGFKMPDVEHKVQGVGYAFTLEGDQAFPAPYQSVDGRSTLAPTHS